MRYAMLVYWLLNGLSVLTIQAQTAVDSIRESTRPAPTVVYTQQDSIRAIQRLFRTRRRTGTWFVVGGTTALATIGVLYGVTSAFSSLGNTAYAVTNQSGPESDNTGYIAAAGIVGVVTLIPTIHLKGSYSRAKEKALIKAYEQGEPLPATVRGALLDKFFRK